jgi:hypothetical protein
MPYAQWLERRFAPTLLDWVDPMGLSAAGKLIQLSKKLYGKVMRPAAGKDARVKIYDKKGSYKNVKVYKDGRTNPPDAKLPKKVIDKAKNLLPVILAFIVDLFDPLDAEAANVGSDFGPDGPHGRVPQTGSNCK